MGSTSSTRFILCIPNEGVSPSKLPITNIVGVLVSGVPRSTCWKAQLRPIYINTARSSSTSTNSRRAQDPCGGVSHEEVQDLLGEEYSPKGSRRIITTSGQRCKLHHQGTSTKQGGETWLSHVQAALRQPGSATCKGANCRHALLPWACPPHRSYATFMGV